MLTFPNHSILKNSSHLRASLIQISSSLFSFALLIIFAYDIIKCFTEKKNKRLKLELKIKTTSNLLFISISAFIALR